MLTIAAALAATIIAAPSSSSSPAYVTQKPSSSSKAARLEQYILRINPKAKAYAAELARCIVLEAARHRLDLPLFAAIAHNESWYQLGARGRWFERGIWQLWPWAKWLRPAFDRYKALQGGPGNLPDLDWQHLTRKQKTALAMNHKVATFMAAYLMAQHARRCRRHNAYCYGKYNRPAAPRRGYVRALRKRARRIRKLLAR